MTVALDLNRYPWRPSEVSRWFAQPSDVRSAARDARLRRSYVQAWSGVPFFQRLWSSEGVGPHDLTGRGDLSQLPTTTIEDYRRSIADHPPFGDVINDDVARRLCTILTSGGTTGFPRPVPVSPTGRERSAELAARSLAFVGVRSTDVLQVTSTFSTHGAAWIATWGAELLGATLVPSSSGAVTRSRDQIELMRHFGVTVLRTSPSYARILAATAQEMGLSPADLGVRIIITAGEVVSPSFRQELETIWNASVHDLYGTMETLVWSSIDCQASQADGGAPGMHIWDDAIVLEVLRPDGSPCEDGEFGELTVTSWLCDVGPKFRYRMGDRVAITSEACACGLPTPRLLPLAGRLDDCLRIRGQNIWPSGLEDAVRLSVPMSADYVLLVDRAESRDRLQLLLAVDQETSLSVSALEGAQRRLKALLGVTMELKLVSPSLVADLSGAGSNRKTRRIVDRRPR